MYPSKIKNKKVEVKVKIKYFISLFSCSESKYHTASEKIQNLKKKIIFFKEITTSFEKIEETINTIKKEKNIFIYLLL